MKLNVYVSVLLLVPGLLLAMQSQIEPCMLVSKNTVKAGEQFEIFAETDSHKCKSENGCEYLGYDIEIIEKEPLEKFSFRAKKDGMVKVICTEEEDPLDRVARIKSSLPNSLVILTHFFSINIE